MSRNQTKRPDEGRKTYTKPEVRRVELTPEESLAAGCKNVSGSAPSGLTCLDNSCFNDGS